MIITTYNMRGLGGRVKRKAVKEFIQAEEVDVVCIQESKLATVDVRVCREVWGDSEVEWRAVPTINNAEGIISMWGKGWFRITDEYIGVGVLGVKGVWMGEVVETVVVNVYSPCNVVGKRAVWDEMMGLRSRWMVGQWCVLGDFNAVRSRDERKGRNGGMEYGSNNEIIEFNNFIDNMRLQYIPIIGRVYTWYRASGGAKSRIDRILVSQEWLMARPMSSQYALKRNISDHYPPVLKHKQINWGPKPFRMINAWFLEPGFQKWAENEYKKMSVNGWGAYVWKEKLKRMKMKLKEWHEQHCGYLKLD